MEGREFLSKAWLKTKNYLMFWKKPKEKKKFNVWDETKDWVISFIIAAMVYFVILPAILGTSSPMVVVSSCSEKGYINIGDILFVQGVNIKDINAPTVEVDRFTDFTPVFNDSEVTSLIIDGNTVELSRDSDIIVYSAFPSKAQIIHRVFAKIYEKSTGNYYLITKGDANPIPDQMSLVGDKCITENTGCISTPISKSMLVGKRVFVNVPLLGHVKLFFCDVITLCDGHSNPGTNYKYMLSC